MYSRAPPSPVDGVHWSREDHNLFLAAIDKYGTGSDSYIHISRYLGDKQPLEVQKHMQEYLFDLRLHIQEKESIRKWSVQENKDYEVLISQHLATQSLTMDKPLIDWLYIGQYFPNRTTMELQDHYQKLCFDVTHIATGMVSIPQYDEPYNRNYMGRERATRMMRKQNSCPQFDFNEQQAAAQNAANKRYPSQQSKNVPNPFFEKSYMINRTIKKPYATPSKRKLSRGSSGNMNDLRSPDYFGSSTSQPLKRGQSLGNFQQIPRRSRTTSPQDDNNQFLAVYDEHGFHIPSV